MKFQIGDYVTPVSNLKSHLNGGIENFIGHVGVIVGWNEPWDKWQVDFKENMEGLADYLHDCGGALSTKTGQNISECDLELVERDECGDCGDLLGADDAIESII